MRCTKLYLRLFRRCTKTSSRRFRRCKKLYLILFKYEDVVCTLSIVSRDDLGAATKRLRDHFCTATKRLRYDFCAAQNCTSHHAIENTIKLEIKRQFFAAQKPSRRCFVAAQKWSLFLAETSLFFYLNIKTSLNMINNGIFVHNFL